MRAWGRRLGGAGRRRGSSRIKPAVRRAARGSRAHRRGGSSAGRARRGSGDGCRAAWAIVATSCIEPCVRACSGPPAGLPMRPPRRSRRRADAYSNREVAARVGARRLHEHRSAKTTYARQQRLELVRLERAPDGGVLVRHPGQRLRVRGSRDGGARRRSRAVAAPLHGRGPRSSPLFAVTGTGGGRCPGRGRVVLAELAGVRLRHERRSGVHVLRHGLALDGRPERLDAEIADLGRELRDAAGLGSRLDRLDLVSRARRSPRGDPPGLMPAFLIDWIAPSAGGPDAQYIAVRFGVRGQDRLRGGRALGLVAVGLELRDDLDLALQRTEARRACPVTRSPPAPGWRGSPRARRGCRQP